MNTFINYAHRGASAYAPENTMPAFKKAYYLDTDGMTVNFLDKLKKLIERN